MFDNEKVNVREILATHQARTVERVTKTSSVILAIQDTCFLNFNEKLTTEGLGHIGSNQTSHHQGLIMHTTFAFDPVEQTALGIIDQDIWARKKEPIRLTARQRKLLPIEQKESIKWLKALRATHEALVDSNKQVVTLADREADIFEFLQEAAHLHQNYVIRAVRNRKILTCDGNSLIWEKLLKQKVAGELDLDIPTKAGHKKRTARLEIRFCPLLIKPTQERPEIRNVAPVQVYGILVKEKNRPEGDALEWMLLTNLKVESFEQAVEKAAWYKCRWQIEVFHKILKTVYRVEDLGLRSAGQLKKYITMACITAWKLQWMIQASRAHPNQACDVILEENEWKILRAISRGKKTSAKKIPTIEESVRWLALLGGFAGRKNDGSPGMLTVARGWQKLKNHIHLKELESCG
jgi:hypothetical protein